jgi:hypothetical protein
MFAIDASQPSSTRKRQFALNLPMTDRVSLSVIDTLCSHGIVSHRDLLSPIDD